MLNSSEVRHYLLEESEARRDLRSRHLTLPFDVLDKRVEDIAIFDFIPVGFSHPETRLPASRHQAISMAEMLPPAGTSIQRDVPAGR